ncbi:MAG: hypothetical protein WCH99_08860 [Verrucomicrobiota bacterium]
MGKNELKLDDRTKITISAVFGWSALVTLVGAAVMLTVNVMEIKFGIREIQRSVVSHSEMQQFNDTLREQNEKLPLKVPPFPNEHSAKAEVAAVIARTDTRKE